MRCGAAQPHLGMCCAAKHHRHALWCGQAPPRRVLWLGYLGTTWACAAARPGCAILAHQGTCTHAFFGAPKHRRYWCFGGRTRPASTGTLAPQAPGHVLKRGQALGMRCGTPQARAALPQARAAAAPPSAARTHAVAPPSTTWTNCGDLYMRCFIRQIYFAYHINA